MPLRILPGSSQFPSLGTSIGTGLGTGLQLLAQNRLQAMSERESAQKTQAGLEALGYDPSTAEKLSGLESNIISQLVKSRLAEGISQPLLDQEVRGMPSQREVFASALTNILGRPDIEAEGGVPAQLQEGVPSEEGIVIPALEESKALQIAKFGLERKKIEEQQRLEFRKESREDQKIIDKKSEGFIKDIKKAARTAKRNNINLNKMEKLAFVGKFHGPTPNALLDTLGRGIFGLRLDLSGIRGADAEEFQALSAEFVRGVKDIFGGRITDNEIRLFMKTLPTLTNSREGMLRIISNMRVANNAAELRNTAMREIISENKGKIPRDLENLIDDRVGPELDRLATIALSTKTPEITRKVAGSEVLGSALSAFGLV